MKGATVSNNLAPESRSCNATSSAVYSELIVLTTPPIEMTP